VDNASIWRLRFSANARKSVLKVGHRVIGNRDIRRSRLTTNVCSKTVMGMNHRAPCNKSVERTKMTASVCRSIMKVRHRVLDNRDTVGSTSI